MSMLRRAVAACAATLTVFAVAVAAPASATITMTLNDDFIDHYANRATIDARVTIDAAAQRPHTAAEDGDMHAAGRSDDIGLATVVEIMNARESDESNAVSTLRGAEGKQIRIVGYWRLWPEHGGSDTVFVQGAPLSPFDTTNPNHAFEIHPILAIGGIDLGESLHEISGYETKDATTAFQAYENEQCRITSSNGTITIVTGMIGYNYVNFGMKLLEAPTAHPLDDGGYSFYADVYDPATAELVAHRVRMVVAPKTHEAAVIAAHRPGDVLTVLGLPRVDLSLARYRATHPDASQWTLPYEMILAGTDDTHPVTDI
ncbi:MAG TPA: hypothetical protein VFB22_02050 [Candidatus Baltobacteraceae bacterium]|nr:hypothetical protein [Candidatus Baltobacteraceae bacterium]